MNGFIYKHAYLLSTMESSQVRLQSTRLENIKVQAVT